MKASELIKELKKYQDFEVDVLITTQAYAGAMFDYTTYRIIDIADVAYSDRRIVLGVE